MPRNKRRSIRSRKRTRRRHGGDLIGTVKALFSRKSRIPGPLGPGSVYGSQFEKYIELLSRKDPSVLGKLQEEIGNGTQIIGQNDEVEAIKITYPERMTVPVYKNKLARQHAEKGNGQRR